MELSELEKQRRANIERNEKLLRELELAGMSQMFDDRQKLTKKSAPSKKRQTLARVKPDPDLLPRRKSRRLEGKKADFEVEQEKAAVQFEETQRVIEESRVRKEGELKLPDMLKDGKWEEALGVLSSMGSKVSQGDYFDKIEVSDPDVQKCREELSNLKLAERFDPTNIKVTTERIFSVAFHPSEENRIALAGDKVGELGIWNMDQASGDGPIDDDTYEEPTILNLKIHTRAIATILFDPQATNKAYTASYDGSVRCLDLSAGKSTEAFVYDSNPRNPVGVSDCALPEPNVLYFTTLEGEFGIHDLREGTKRNKTKLMRLHDKKIGGFSYNPNAIHQIATASLDRTLKLWDLRAVSPVPDNEYGEVAAHNYGEYSSRLSVSCSDWNSTGSIVVNGYDDTINVFDLSKSVDWTPETTLEGTITPSVRIKHNCQTGRWVSILKSRWQQHPRDGVSKFVIANMKRFIDVYSADGQQLAHLGHDAMSAVPAVADMHPTRNWIVGGSASGKLYLWE